MATQRITIAKIGGEAGAIALTRLSNWSAARQFKELKPSFWSADQWTESTRRDADDFAERLRMNAFCLPVIHFVEWADMWSMGDLFKQWLTPSKGSSLICVYGNQHEIFAYSLPDSGQLLSNLSSAGPQNDSESDWFVTRLRETVESWNSLVERSTIVVLRRVVGPSVLDEEIVSNMECCPDWLS